MPGHLIERIQRVVQYRTVDLKTLQEIADIENITRERVRQILLQEGIDPNYTKIERSKVLIQRDKKEFDLERAKAEEKRLEIERLEASKDNKAIAILRALREQGYKSAAIRPIIGHNRYNRLLKNNPELNLRGFSTSYNALDKSVWDDRIKTYERLKSEGKTQEQIAQALGLSKTFVASFTKKFPHLKGTPKPPTRSVHITPFPVQEEKEVVEQILSMLKKGLFKVAVRTELKLSPTNFYYLEKKYPCISVTYRNTREARLRNNSKYYKATGQSYTDNKIWWESFLPKGWTLSKFQNRAWAKVQRVGSDITLKIDGQFVKDFRKEK